MKNKFTFFDNFKETADKLPDDLRLKFYDAMTDYVFKDVEPDDIVVSALIAAIKPYLDNEVSSWGGAREGAGRKRKNQDKSNEIKFNQVELEKLEKNQDTLEKLEKNQDLQKEEKKTSPLTIPQQENNKNIYNSPHSKECTPLLPKDDSGMYDIEELIAKSEPKPKPKKKAFVPPTLPEVQEYVKERGLMIDPAAFFDYFTEGEWKDSEGKPVKNWKQKALTWDCSARTRRTLDAARHLLPKKSAVKSQTYSEEIPL